MLSCGCPSVDIFENTSSPLHLKLLFVVMTPHELSPAHLSGFGVSNLKSKARDAWEKRKSAEFNSLL